MTDNDPVISVALVTYNHAKYIRQSVDSILSQRCEHKYEIIVADDASTDGTQEILRNYADRYPDKIRLLLNDRNFGWPNKNGYQALSNAKGKYLAVLEGDDFWCDDYYLQKGVDYLESHPEYSAVQFGNHVVDENGEVREEFEESSGTNFWNFDKDIFTLDDFARWQMPGHGNARICRNFMKDGDDCKIIYEAHPYIGDKTITMLEALRGPIKRLDDKILCYRYVVKKGEKNWMSIRRSRNTRFEEYKMVCTLHDYLRDKYNINLNMNEIKDNMLAGAVIVNMMNPTADNREVVSKILSYQGKSLKKDLVALSAFIQKKYYILTGRPDHRVKIK